MNVVILAGGLGTRLAEETEVKPKPMVEIGGRPILWHIMKHYAHYGFKEFFIALGYKGEAIKRYFLDYYGLSGSMTIDLTSGKVDVHKRECEDWILNLIDTGSDTNTGGRVKSMERWLNGGTFMVTYGDGVCDVNLAELLKFHKQHGRLATVTAVRPPARFGGLAFDGDHLADFIEKPQTGEGWINGGYLVFEPDIFKYLDGEQSSLEADALEQLAADRQLVAFPHNQFWQCMDTLRDVRLLENLWQENAAPWKVWE
ncbi:MAG: glucose-phosphate cytidylyltransferase [Acidobacteriota bacterium]|jgi:glucose-1-phosphate cytidylyltransferase|nr:glucose-phosphate cytidylyltransferase [Acidobacteriota bacterium]